MKLSDLIAALPPGTDPEHAEILIFDPWGELSPAVTLAGGELVPGDPLIEDLAELGIGTIVLHSEP